MKKLLATFLGIAAVSTASAEGGLVCDNGEVGVGQLVVRMEQPKNNSNESIATLFNGVRDENKELVQLDVDEKAEFDRPSEAGDEEFVHEFVHAEFQWSGDANDTKVKFYSYIDEKYIVYGLKLVNTDNSGEEPIETIKEYEMNCSGA